ncbi:MULTISPECIES: thiol:disulfide interchange protein DsbA/DsbL [Vibrio]|uniref:Thiol:disulfide interchange protein n=1 Tax=Vibrio algicola TaxID=2662262 RepID=A0A5Q0TGZ4_9VIBR|nr:MULTISPECIES: thiol:disulfide interchange protein DsbA/DsbL [Vibrio]MBD1577292.1 thiol:disulfide interchange protein DsbA/DsbL [Vibrio sp. S11_S32]
MKKIFTLVAALMLSFTVNAASFKEGDNYKVLDTAHSSSPTVTEFFSFYCPHCNAFEPIIGQLKKHVEGRAEFQKMSVSFMGGNMGQAMSKGYATMVSLGVDDKLVPLMFNRIHVQNNAPRNEAELRQFFLDNGIAAKDFDGTFNSFAIDSMVRRYDKSFTDAGLSGVPAIIVNGKYLVELKNFQNVDQAFDLIDYLLKK